ncbi:MAG: DUF4924 family protein [Bacteroidota bacterium]|nr:DUF4924 family protein [Bacteroidota bacterium]
MIIAKQKKQENLAEYVLYMWQIEDMIRACQFEIEIIKDKLIAGFDISENQKQEMFFWYEGLIQQMHDEKIKEKGHLQFLINQVNDLQEFHLYLLNDESETTYHEFASIAAPNIELFRKKSKEESANDTQVCLTALYSLLILRLQKRKITKDTEQAMSSFSNLLGLLSKKYIEFHKGEAELNN